MALSALETSLIQNEFLNVFSKQTPFTRDVMITAGVSGQAAKSTDVQAVVATVLTQLFGTAAPTVSP